MGQAAAATGCRQLHRTLPDRGSVRRKDVRTTLRREGFAASGNFRLRMHRPFPAVRSSPPQGQRGDALCQAVRSVDRFSPVVRCDLAQVRSRSPQGRPVQDPDRARQLPAFVSFA